MTVLEKHLTAKSAEREAYTNWNAAWCSAYRDTQPTKPAGRGHKAAIAALQKAYLHAAAKEQRIAAFGVATEQLNVARAALSKATNEIVAACKCLNAGVTAGFEFTDTVEVSKWVSSGFGSYCGGTSVEIVCGSTTHEDGPAKNNQFGSSWVRNYKLSPGTVMVVRSYGPNGEGPSESWYCNPPS